MTLRYKQYLTQGYFSFFERTERKFQKMLRCRGTLLFSRRRNSDLHRITQAVVIILNIILAASA